MSKKRRKLEAAGRPPHPRGEKAKYPKRCGFRKK